MMSVTSEQSTITIDGKFLITGKLFVTRVERSARLEPIEPYAGPAYGKRRTHTDTREITLTFSDSRQLATSKDVMQFRGTTSVRGEDFSQLLQALIQDSWPTVLVNNDNCEEPSTTDEDYSGFQCTGTDIAEVNNRFVPTGGIGGNGYFGFQPTVIPDRNYAAIAFDLNSQERVVRAGRNTS
jgi:hypothetical protein